MDLVAILKSNNLKATKARIKVLECLSSHNEPVTTPTIIKHLRENKISSDEATIFRTVNSLLEKGLISQFQFKDKVARYEIATKPEHHHVICTNCGRVEDILDCSVEKIEKEINLKKGFKIMSHSLEFFGLCPKCKTREL